MSHLDSEKCHVDEWVRSFLSFFEIIEITILIPYFFNLIQDDVTTASRRIFVVENQDNEVLIRKLISHGMINYLPWAAESEAHHLLTK